jgi:hypothetical protein
MPDIMDELVGAMQPTTGETVGPPKLSPFYPRAKGARKMVLNRAAVDQIILATADGLFELAKSIVQNADVPDAAPYGVGLVQGGGAVAYVGKKRVAEWSKTGDTVKKPRAAKLSPKGTDGVTVIFGYGFPGRFQEVGTVKQAAKPFLTPATMAELPAAEGYIRAAWFKSGVISAKRALRGDTYQANQQKTNDVMASIFGDEARP